MLVVDGTTSLLAKARVGSGMVKIELADAEEFKLVYGEAEFPGDVSPMDRSRGDFWGDFLFCSAGRGHGVVFKYWREWARL